MFNDDRKYDNEYKDIAKAVVLPHRTPEESLKLLADNWGELAQNIANILTPIIEVVKNAIKYMADILKTYPNQRVVYLALHGKPRVRKKNIKRITKWLEREEKWKTK